MINDSESGHNGILAYNTEYTISGAEITMLTDADGSDTCDFSGKGTAVAAFGSDANITITDSTIHTAGVATIVLGGIYPSWWLSKPRQSGTNIASGINTDHRDSLHSS